MLSDDDGAFLISTLSRRVPQASGSNAAADGTRCSITILPPHRKGMFAIQKLSSNSSAHAMNYVIRSVCYLTFCTEFEA